MRRAVILGRYGADDLLTMFVEAGVVAAIGKRGYDDVAVEIDDAGGPLTHTRLTAAKGGTRYLLLDACLTELHLEPGAKSLPLDTGGAAVDLLVVYWLREQDPTAAFDARHERLPLQEYPGLGVLRRAFPVVLRVARELGKHGVAALPKYFHDAAIFYHSRLFLFLDPAEQGRFEALMRDLSGLSLASASLALLGSAVRDAEGGVAAWRPGLQVMPLGALLTERFHGESYQAACRAAFEASRFSVDEEALAAARRVFETSVTAPDVASAELPGYR